MARATEAHSAALHQALQEIHGVDARRLEHSIDPAGRTDGEIARLLLLVASVSAVAIDERAVDVREACTRIYAELCPPSLADKVLPGIVALLDWLSELDQVRLSLVTGNYEPVARLKLKRAGIGHYFASGQGGFGSDSEDRAALPPLARRRAGHDGVPFPPRADDRDRRHAARHRLRPGRRRALRRGRHRPLRLGAGRRGCQRRPRGAHDRRRRTSSVATREARGGRFKSAARVSSDGRRPDRLRPAR